MTSNCSTYVYVHMPYVSHTVSRSSRFLRRQLAKLWLQVYQPCDAQVFTSQSQMLLESSVTLNEIKVELSPWTPLSRMGGSGGLSPLILNLDTKWR